MGQPETVVAPNGTPPDPPQVSSTYLDVLHGAGCCGGCVVSVRMCVCMASSVKSIRIPRKEKRGAAARASSGGVRRIRQHKSTTAKSEAGAQEAAPQSLAYATTSSAQGPAASGDASAAIAPLGTPKKTHAAISALDPLDISGACGSEAKQASERRILFRHAPPDDSDIQTMPTKRQGPPISPLWTCSGCTAAPNAAS